MESKRDTERMGEATVMGVSREAAGSKRGVSRETSMMSLWVTLLTGNHAAPVGLIAFPREQERPGTSPGALIEFHPKGRKHQPQQHQQEQQPQQACGLRTEPSAICREVRRVYKVSARTCLCKLLQQNAANLKTDMIVFGQIKEGRTLSIRDRCFHFAATNTEGKVNVDCNMWHKGDCNLVRQLDRQDFECENSTSEPSWKASVRLPFPSQRRAEESDGSRKCSRKMLLAAESCFCQQIVEESSELSSDFFFALEKWKTFRFNDSYLWLSFLFGCRFLKVLCNWFE